MKNVSVIQPKAFISVEYTSVNGLTLTRQQTNDLAKDPFDAEPKLQ